jgi:hypothetical protein
MKQAEQSRGSVQATAPTPTKATFGSHQRQNSF